MGKQKALVSGAAGAGVAVGSVQFFETFKWLFLSAGAPANVADELTTVANMAIAFGLSYLVTYLIPNRA